METIIIELIGNRSTALRALAFPEASLCCGEAGEKEKESARGIVPRAFSRHT